MPSSSTARQIFMNAVEKHDAQQWPAFLDGACGDDADLRSRVEELLAAHRQNDSFLDRQPATISCSVEETSGSVIGPFKLLQKIGEGGFGVVYMAEQTKPVRRKVALKIIKPGMDSKEVIARFEAERQALAMMDHPNIAKVLDVGATDSGLPYFAMELVKGVTITEYADNNHLSTKERLTLFASICRAVHHAHQKGVIHRDLKPSNVMVTLHDGKPVAKVIDFGVSKAVSQPLTEQTLFTRYGQVIGTPQYMSPEQAEMSGLDVDTRSDIYSLGVILYELLTGRTPFSAEQIRAAGFDEMRRILKEEEPLRPSNALQTLDVDTATSVASNRACRPDSLQKIVRGELDWIVMRTLEKDRNRRYDSANSLAEDIDRHLMDEPVEASPPSVAYRMWKSYRRNRNLYVAAGCIATSLLVGLAVAIRFAAIAESNRREALASEDKAKAQTLFAEEAAKRAESEAKAAKQSLDFVIDVLSKTDINPDTEEEYTVREAVSEIANLDAAVSDGGEILQTASGNIRLPPSAMIQLNFNLGTSLQNKLEFYRAAQHFEAAARIAASVHGEKSLEHARYLRLQGIASGEEQKILNAINIERSLDSRAELMSSLTKLGQLRVQNENYAGAIEPLEEATRLFEVNSEMLLDDLPQMHLMFAHRRIGNREKAHAFEAQAIAAAQRLKPAQGMTRTNWYNLGKNRYFKIDLHIAELALLVCRSLSEKLSYQPNYYIAKCYIDADLNSEAGRLVDDCLEYELDVSWRQAFLELRAEVAKNTGRVDEAIDYLWAVFENEGSRSKGALEEILVMSDDHEAVRQRLESIQKDMLGSSKQGDVKEGFAERKSNALDLIELALTKQDNVARLVEVTKATGLSPDKTWPSAYIAGDFDHVGELLDAEVSYDSQMGTHELAWIAARRGRASYHLRDYENAEKHLQAAIKHMTNNCPDNAPLNVWMNLEYGSLLLAMGKEESARDYFQKAADNLSSREKNQGYVTSKIGDRSVLLLGLVAGNTKVNSSQMETDILGCLRMSPLWHIRYGGHENLAALYRNEGMPDLETEQLEQATWLIPSHAQALPAHYMEDRLVELYLQSHEVDRGSQHFERLVEKFDSCLVDRHPKRAFLRINLAKILLRMDGRGEQASQVLQEAQTILAKHEGVPTHVTEEITELLEEADAKASL